LVSSKHVGIRVRVSVIMKVFGIQGSLFYSYTQYFQSECYLNFHKVQWQSFCWGFGRQSHPTAEKFGTQYVNFIVAIRMYTSSLSLFITLSPKKALPFFLYKPHKKPSFK